MEVGGSDYRRLKEELDRLVDQVSETERTLNKNRHTVQSSSDNIRKLDREIDRAQDDISKLTQEKDKL